MNIENEDVSKSLSDYVAVGKRRKKIIVVVTCVVFVIGLLAALLWPSTYRSTAVILIESQDIPPDLVRSTITSYPTTTDPDFKMLIGYGANADRYEDWRTNLQPLQDSQQPFNGTSPLNTYPANPTARDSATGFLITGQVPASSVVATHTGGDIPLSAYGRGASLFNGVMDNTDVFFAAMQAAIGGSK